MKVLLKATMVALIGLVMMISAWPKHHKMVRAATSEELVTLVGGAGDVSCFYPTTTTCLHASPEQSCNDLCEWDDLITDDEESENWGNFGAWRCPEPDQNIEINEITTAYSTCDELIMPGNEFDMANPVPDDCDLRQNCSCSSEPPPNRGGFFSLCEPGGVDISNTTGNFRIVDEDSDLCPDVGG